MTKKIASFIALFLALNVVPLLSAEPTYITVSGTVTDDKSNAVKDAIIQVAYKNGELSDTGTITDTNGRFKLEGVSPDTVVIVSGAIYEKQIIPVSENMSIKLTPNSLAEVSIEDRNCTGITGAIWGENEHKCICKKQGQVIRNKVCVDIDDNDTAPVDTRTDEQKAQELAEKKATYEKAKETAQSKANKTLTSLSTAATGIGGMELAQGLAEQKADKEAEQSMSAYIATMRCKYGKDKQVKAGQTEIELPGGNDANIMKYRSEYIALATDLKTRKNALGLATGIESEEILDKAQMNLYSQENLGINDGAYSSLYRAQMYDSEKDKTQIADEKQTSKNRVIGGAVAAGVGVVGGFVGDSLINGKLGEKIKEARANKNATKIEGNALNKLKQCLKDAGATNTNKLSFQNFTPSILNLSNIDCKNLNLNGKDATTLFADTTDGDTACETLATQIGQAKAKQMMTGCKFEDEPEYNDSTDDIYDTDIDGEDEYLNSQA